MNILIYMDPFVDFLDEENPRSFVLRYDMMPHLLARQFGKNASIKVFCYEKLLEKNGVKDILNKLFFRTISEYEINNILNNSKLSAEDVIRENFNDNFLFKFNKILSSLGDDWTPDIVIGWGIVPKYINKIYKNSLILEAEHSPLFRITKNPDVFFLPKNEDFNEQFLNYILDTNLTKDQKEELSRLSTELKKIADPTGVSTRNYFGDEVIGKKIIFYPGHFKSPYALYFSNYSGDEDILINILKHSPEDAVILYLRHPLTKEADTPHIVKLSDKIIDISYLYEIDNNIALKAILLCDLFINSHSKTSFIAHLFEKKVIELDDKFYYSKIIKNDINDIKKFLSDDTYCNTFSYMKKYIYFLLTHAPSLRLLQCEKMYSYFLVNIYNACINNDYKLIPTTSTISELTSNVDYNLFANSNRDFERVPTVYDEIKGCIISSNYKNICFDIFDTLLWRPFNKPTDLFYLIAKDVSVLLKSERFDFFSARISAEWHARRKCANIGNEDITFDDIYESFSMMFNISPELCKKIAEIEKKYEEKFIQCRNSAKYLVDLAIYCNKNIYAVSDMYLSSLFLSKLLYKAGYKKFDNVIVSSDEKAMKSTGRMFQVLKDKYNIIPSKSIFIGDNINSDVLKPKEFGFRSFYFPSALQCMKKKTNFAPFYNTMLNHCIATHFSVIANTIFDNPYIFFDKKTIFNNSQYLIGFLAFGPLLVNFTGWLIENITDKNYDSLLFCSRDCFCIEKIYKLYKIYIDNLPKEKYIYISRYSTLPCFQDKQNEVLLVDKYSSNYDAIKFIKKYFYVNEDNDIIKYNKRYLMNIGNNIIEKSKLQEFIKTHKFFKEDEIQQKQKIIRDYILQETNGNSFAIVDSGARGTSRDAISDLLSTDIDLYLFRSYRYKFSEKNNTFVYHKESFNYFRCGRAAFTSAFYEPLISCVHEGSCIGYKKEEEFIIPILDDVENTLNQQYVCFIHRGILDFAEKYITIFGDNAKNMILEPSIEMFKAPLEFVHARMSDYSLFEKFVHIDPMTGYNGSSRILMPPLEKSIPIKKTQHNMCISNNKHINSNKKRFISLEKLVFSKILYGRKLNKYLKNRDEFFIDSKIKLLHVWYNYLNKN